MATFTEMFAAIQATIADPDAVVDADGLTLMLNNLKTNRDVTYRAFVNKMKSRIDARFGGLETQVTQEGVEKVYQMIREQQRVQ